LVYCLPIRCLVEQTVQAARRWTQALGEVAEGIEVYQLTGGEVDQDWDRFPQSDAVLVGTQDQLLSRALDRGYSMSRYR
jgi:CRISPR-associated endonuclease/helicase Cas3